MKSHQALDDRGVTIHHAKGTGGMNRAFELLQAK
jgi:hypothetical protein